MIQIIVNCKISQHSLFSNKHKILANYQYYLILGLSLAQH